MTADTAVRTVTVQEVMDPLPLGRMQILILLLAVAITMVDTADLQLLAFAAPAILTDWGISKLALTPALSAALFGMIIGALAGGTLGDRWGRKRTLLIAILVMGIGTIMTGFARDVTELTIMRFIAGIGFGATTPTAYALGIEALPQRSRTWASAVLAMVNAAGSMVGSLIALSVIPAFGWRASFLVSGGLTLALGVIVLVMVPESASYLLAKGKQTKALASLRRILGHNRVSPDILLAPRSSSDNSPPKEGGGLAALFSREYRRTTMGTWIVYFATTFATYASITWLPTILTNHQWSFETAMSMGTVTGIAAVTGSLLVALGGRMIGSRRFMWTGAVAFIVSAASMPFLISLGSSIVQPVLALVTACALSGFATGSLMAINLAVVGLAYPVNLRSQGVGYALASARLGSTIATIVAGAILFYTHDNLFVFFGVILCAGLVVAVGSVTIDQHIRPAGRGRRKPGTGRTEAASH
ncbi:MFS transporter [Sphingobium lactosutens]|uniref:Major facilitator superfamily (MFS) profile domain-containing protein n=1 Tax=Sphingobium lactosutens DS20 TaxID=1331060 RepID=T0HKY3_9SPHN|nr:MFS transporter [Sphingobium lactosutens]EQB17016.1 hypothetical protein RLDS_06165 [Sphingobium lactosutens DS20]